MPYIRLSQLMDCRILLSVIMNHCLQANNLKTLFINNGIENITTTPYQQSSNGAAEKAVQTFKPAMREIVVESGNAPIKTLISWFCFLTVMPHRHTEEKHHRNYCLIGK